MRLKILIIIFGVIINSISVDSNAQDSYRWSKNSCEKFIKDYSSYWIGDSIANNGFRFMVYRSELFNSCSLIGQKWEEWKAYFGKPTQSGNIESQIIYLYKMTNFGVFDIVLHIHVDKSGVIVDFFEQQPCG